MLGDRGQPGWCRPGGEDTAEPRLDFSPSIFEHLCWKQDSDLVSISERQHRSMILKLSLPGIKFWRLCLLLLAPVTIASPACAGDIAQVKVGAFTKRAYGTLSSASGGDRACYLSLKDDRGAVFEEMADFDFCEPKNIRRYRGKRLALAYEIASVLAAECEGNMDCGKSDRVAMIKKLRIAPARPRKK